MRVYLVRHGESEGNVARVHQRVNEPLTAHGIQQAKKVARRFQKLTIDRIIVSHAKRALQTAHEIELITGAPKDIDENLLEKRGATQFIGEKHHSKKSQKAYEKMMEHIDDPQYHFADEENNWDFIVRIDKALKAIETRTEENIVVVSHGFSIKALVGLMLFGPEFSSREFELLKMKLETSNTGITVCENSPVYGWKIVTFNDNAHLLE